MQQNILQDHHYHKTSSGSCNSLLSVGLLIVIIPFRLFVFTLNKIILLDEPQHYYICQFVGRKDIKVKALEAAEAAKRLEEKKQNEREMRKAAVKLEREKLEQENIRCLELKQKQKEEERKKKEADIAARKRQREEEGRKEKERKRRCIEETRRQKREQEEKSHSEKVGKKFQ